MGSAKKYRELDCFNAIACLFVVLIHVLSVGVNELDPSTIQGAAVFLLWHFSMFVIRGFLFTGAVKMAMDFSRKDSMPCVRQYLRYLLRRITKIYLPYVVWVGIYYLYFLWLGWVEAGADVFLRYVIVGDLSAPFYYIVVVMQFYVLMPFWRWMVERIPFFSALLTSAMVTFFMLYAEDVLLGMGITASFRGRVFPSYLLFWVVGLYVGRYYDTVRAGLVRHVRSVIALLVPVLLYELGVLWQHIGGVMTVDENVIRIFADSMSICVLLTLCILLCDCAADRPILQHVTKLLSFVFSASFTVYLSHCLFLEITAAGIRVLGIADIGVQLVLRAAVCFTMPFLLWYGWDLVQIHVQPLYKKLLGKE